MTTKQPNRPALFWRLAKQVRPCWQHLTGLFLLSLLAPPLALLTPLPLKIVFDNILDSHPLPRFLGAVLPEALIHSQAGKIRLVIGMILLVAILAQVREFGSALLAAFTGEKLLRSFRAQLFRHVQRLSLSYHDTKGTSDSTYRIQYDATAINNIAVDGIVPFFTSALTFTAMICAIARINWRLALVALGVSPVIFVVSRIYRRRLRRQSKEVKKIESAALSVVHEVLGAARVVKAFGQEDREEGRFIQQSNLGLWARMRLASMEGSLGILVAIITAAGMATVVFIGIGAIQSGALTRGGLVLVMGYLAQLYGPLKTISKKMASMQSHLASAERAFSLLDEAPDVVERPHARPLGRSSGAMTFRNVSFGYNSERPVLRNLFFEVEPGTCLGIAGTTGAGKTTLVSLLTRFYDPTAGEILLDGVDLRNIAYARAGASKSEIIAAARAAKVHEFISGLPQGYQTLVGERGMCLSGGERQRISLARAFLKDAPILILDEPTSSVDIRTEEAIVEAMERLMQNRTTFVIAHRPSTLQHCDCMLKIEHGRVASFESRAPTALAAALPEGSTVHV